jgi:hypothetical protein
MRVVTPDSVDAQYLKMDCPQQTLKPIIQRWRNKESGRARTGKIYLNARNNGNLGFDR